MIHLATAAIVNAVWDLWAKAEGKPVWKLLSDMSPEEIVRCIDFRYITDALTPDEALEILRRNESTRAEREGDAAGRLPGVHDQRRLARLFRRQDPGALSRGGRRGLDAFQAEGWRRHRRRRAAGVDHP